MAVKFDEQSIAESQQEAKAVREDLAAQQAEQNEELTTEQEYELWKKNCSLMYDYVNESHLKWPSLSVQWFPETVYDAENECLDTRLLVGTNTSGEDQENVKIMSANLPTFVSDKFVPAANGNIKRVVTSMKLKKKYRHYRTEVNRARYMPQDTSVMASISGEGTVFVYNESEKNPVAKLQSHKDNGYGLDWNVQSKARLLSGADDKKVCLWDVSSTTQPLLNELTDHEDIVNDVKWHKFSANLFGTVSDDKKLLIYDTRDLRSPMITRDNVHKDSVNALAFSPFSTNLLATGSSDSTIGLFDMRNLDKKLHSMMGHSKSVTTLEWSPHSDGFIASGSEDKRVIVWDISRIGEEQSPDDAEDGAPELFFMHAGHTGLVTDLSWHPELKWLVASVSDDNVLQLWKSTKSLTRDWEDVVDLRTLE